MINQFTALALLGFMTFKEYSDKFIKPAVEAWFERADEALAKSGEMTGKTISDITPCFVCDHALISLDKSKIVCDGDGKEPPSFVHHDPNSDIACFGSQLEKAELRLQQDPNYIKGSLNIDVVRVHRPMQPDAEIKGDVISVIDDEYYRRNNGYDRKIHITVFKSNKNTE